MYFENCEVMNFEGALRGMRNPLNSWSKSDSVFDYCSAGLAGMYVDNVARKWVAFSTGGDEVSGGEVYTSYFKWLYENGVKFLDKNSRFCQLTLVGPNDMRLAQSLIKAGAEHCKFLRQIPVSVDWTATRYTWAEIDTYHFNTKNSCSTMHKLFDKNRKIELADFGDGEKNRVFLAPVIQTLNSLRDSYFVAANSKEKDSILHLAKQILPESYLQKRTVVTSYAELRNMYHQRKNHRLPEWSNDFCNFVSKLPYAKELIIYEN